MKELGIFDESDRLARLSELGDSLEKLNTVIQWKMFRPELENVFKKDAKAPGGRPAYDRVMLFKILVLERIYQLSDDEVEYQINDRMSFMRFLGLSLHDRVPDAKTIWLFRDNLAKAEMGEKLFHLFANALEEAHLITHTGTIVDATFVDAPRQRNSREENEKIKRGEIPEEWGKPENAHKMAQKDTDARWTKKNDETHYGYKDHVKADADSKLIADYTVTDAAVHDSVPFPHLITETDNVVYADSAYSGKTIEEQLPATVQKEICEKGYRNRLLTERQKANNRRKSHIRSRVEHIFGFMTNTMHGLSLRCIGICRAKFQIGMTNLIYNMCRYEFLIRPKKITG